MALRGPSMYHYVKPNRWTSGVGAELPEAYKKFWREWKSEPSPVHYIPKEGKYERYPDGQVHPIQNHPLPLKYPKELNKGLWGGEAIVQGFVKKSYDRRRVPKFWVPLLKNSVVYSEILDKYMTMTITYRTLDLIHKHYGLDHYILKTGAMDLKSVLALKLKKEMMVALYEKTLYPNDAEKREQIFNKYKHYLEGYTREDLEWYGLTYDEAVLKFLNEKEENQVPQPMKHVYRQKLIEELKLEKQMQTEAEKEQRKESWLSKMNPFSNLKTD